MNSDVKLKSGTPINKRTLDFSLPNNEFKKDFEDYSNKVTLLLNRHNHKDTCHKYHGDEKECRFGVLCATRGKTSINEGGVIQLKRNHLWINNWNPAIGLCICINKNISFLITKGKELSIVHYITD